eukprot:scaffold30356_cov68-Phaeocystis_antarctica.AAC.1
MQCTCTCSEVARLQQPRRVALAVRAVLAEVVEELSAADVLHDDVEGVLRLVAALELGDARVHRDALQHRDLVQDGRRVLLDLGHLLDRHQLAGPPVRALPHDRVRARAEGRAYNIVVLNTAVHDENLWSERLRASEAGSCRACYTVRSCGARLCQHGASVSLDEQAGRCDVCRM